jgi:serine/threonine protein kinase
MIGQGAFGKVFLGLDQETGRSFAVKELALKGGAIMPNDSADKGICLTFMFGYSSSTKGSVTSSSSAAVVKQLEEEINVMRCLCHENIVRYIGTQRTASVLHIFLEYVDRGSIQSVYQKVGLEEGAVRKYTYGLLSGLAYLHSEDIIHGDVKAANVLVDKYGVVKLADFGCARLALDEDEDASTHRLDEDDPSHDKDRAQAGGSSDSGEKGKDSAEASKPIPLVGTIPWMAPEVVRQEQLDKKSDIWSVGCTIIEMASGQRPWPEYTNPMALMLHIARDPNAVPLIPSSLSQHAQEVVKCCLKRTPTDRTTAAELLQMEWLSTTAPDTDYTQRSNSLSLTNSAARSPGVNNSRGTPATRGRSVSRESFSGRSMGSVGDSFSHLLDGKYRIIRGLGRGNFGRTYEVVSEADRQQYAVKMLIWRNDGDSRLLSSMRREADVVQPLQHPNIVRYYSAFCEAYKPLPSSPSKHNRSVRGLHPSVSGGSGAESCCYGLVFEYLPGGSLWSMMRRVKQKQKQAVRKAQSRSSSLTGESGPELRQEQQLEQQQQQLEQQQQARVLVLEWLRQLCHALAYLHHHLQPPLVHRDLHGGNVLLDKRGNVKLIDFGQACSATAPATPSPLQRKVPVNPDPQHSSATPKVGGGAIFYAAPETIRPSSPSHTALALPGHVASVVSTSQDLWALGCLAAELVLGEDLRALQPARRLCEGDRVESRRGGQQKWRSSRVVAVTQHEGTDGVGVGADCTCELEYEDGEREKEVPRFRIRFVGEVERKRLAVDERVDVVYAGREGGVLYNGRVAKVHEGRDSGLFDITYDDGDAEQRVQRVHINGSYRCAALAADADAVGAVVAQVTKAWPEMSEVVRRMLERSPASRIDAKEASAMLQLPNSSFLPAVDKRVQTAMQPVLRQTLQGLCDELRVEARHHGQRKWYPARVVRAVCLEKKDADCTFELEYDDGDREDAVPRYRIRCAGEVEREKLGVGERVDAIFKKGGTLFSGRVVKANLSARAFLRAGDRQDGKGGVGADSYDIRYDDGDLELGVCRESIYAACFAVDNTPPRCPAGHEMVGPRMKTSWCCSGGKTGSFKRTKSGSFRRKGRGCLSGLTAQEGTGDYRCMYLANYECRQCSINLCGVCVEGQVKVKQQKEDKAKAKEAKDAEMRLSEAESGGEKDGEDPVAVVLNWNLAGLQSSPWEFAVDAECSMLMQKHTMLLRAVQTDAQEFLRTSFGDIVDDIFGPKMGAPAKGSGHEGSRSQPLSKYFTMAKTKATRRIFSVPDLMERERPLNFLQLRVEEVDGYLALEHVEWARLWTEHVLRRGAQAEEETEGAEDAGAGGAGGAGRRPSGTAGVRALKRRDEVMHLFVFDATIRLASCYTVNELDANPLTAVGLTAGGATKVKQFIESRSHLAHPSAKAAMFYEIIKAALAPLIQGSESADRGGAVEEEEEEGCEDEGEDEDGERAVPLMPIAVCLQEYDEGFGLIDKLGTELGLTRAYKWTQGSQRSGTVMLLNAGWGDAVDDSWALHEKMVGLSAGRVERWTRLPRGRKGLLPGARVCVHGLHGLGERESELVREKVRRAVGGEVDVDKDLEGLEATVIRRAVSEDEDENEAYLKADGRADVAVVATGGADGETGRKGATGNEGEERESEDESKGKVRRDSAALITPATLAFGKSTADGAALEFYEVELLLPHASATGAGGGGGSGDDRCSCRLILPRANLDEGNQKIVSVKTTVRVGGEDVPLAVVAAHGESSFEDTEMIQQACHEVYGLGSSGGKGGGGGGAEGGVGVGGEGAASGLRGELGGTGGGAYLLSMDANCQYDYGTINTAGGGGATILPKQRVSGSGLFGGGATRE